MNRLLSSRYSSLLNRQAALELAVMAALIATLSPLSALAASCCGGSFAVPSIINGDDRAQLTASYGFTEVKVDSVDSGGMWYVSDRHQRSQTLKLEGAHLLSDKWQAGFSLPVINRASASPSGGTASGLGDLSADLAYEFLSDWDYNPYRPKGIAFLSLNIPLSKARAESEVGGLDSRGSGFWALGAGALLSKAFGRWDVLSSLDLHRSLEKSISSSQLAGTLQPGFGGNFSIGAGYSFLPAWRLGGGITWTYEDAITLKSNSSESIVNGMERYATATLSISHVSGEEWAETLTYSDQTLFGAPVNTSLGRGIMALLQRRWGR